MIERVPLQFRYQFRHYDAQGRLISDEVSHNLIPTVGREYMMAVLFGSTAQISGWYMGLFGDQNYTPAYTDDAAFLASNAGEITDYGTQRLAFGAALNGSSWGNSASPATFTATAPITVYGGFISSAQSFNSSVGTLLSEVKAPSPRSLDTGESLDVTATITMLT
jgi:hypothetical protein